MHLAGESQMHYCEVILKDVEDSGRINKHIQGKSRGEAVREREMIKGKKTARSQ